MINIGIGIPFGQRSAGIDPQAQAYLTATGITGETQKQAINNLVKGLKTDGVWNKMKAVYPFVTDNSNLLSYSENFSDATWVKSNSSVTSNSTTAPNGTLTADSIIPNTANAFHNVRILNLTTQVSPYTYSIYAKASGYNFIGIQIASDSSFTNYFEGVFNLSNGTIENTGRAVGYTGLRSIESVGNGWYRCSISITNSISSSTALVSAVPQITNDPTTSYIGNGTFGVFVWGAQLELGSTATTYQPILTTQQAYIANQFKFNLINPLDTDAAFRLVFNGGWTHSSNGATPNGTNGFADTKLNPFLALINNNYHLSHYSRTQKITGNEVDLAVVDTTRMIGVTQYYGGISAKAFVAGDYTSSQILVNNTNTLGLLVGTRTSQTLARMFMNSAQVGSDLTLSNPNTLPNRFLYLGSNNNGVSYEFSSKQVAFSSIGDGLTNTEASNLYIRVQAYQTALNRQV
jgi:hypothetical protein